MDWCDAGHCLFLYVEPFGKEKKELILSITNGSFLFVLAAITGAISGLYDKYLMKSLNPMLVQSWYNVLSGVYYVSYSVIALVA